MKRNIALIAAAVTLALLVLSLPVLAQRHPSELSSPPPLSFKMPKPVMFSLASGIRVAYIQDT
ncbi:MAG TPA: hypothetical protein VKT17_03795, partial [Acidobacteriota bacterium]|nr:hypothetical protein [Acidobacteriota bacterium]